MSDRRTRLSLLAPAAVPGRSGSDVAPWAIPSYRVSDGFGRTISRLLPAQLHVQLLWGLLAASFMVRIFWLAQPEGALIFDEKYYVNAARVILSIPPGQNVYQDAKLGLDPNTEHPPLAKLFVAGSMLLLGDNPFGWRTPSIVFGTLSILLMYGVARRLGADAATGLLAAGLLAFDNLMFVHSRIFTLDIFQVTFMLLGIYWYLGGRTALAGTGLALAALCKIGGVFGLFTLAGYEVLLLVHPDRPKQRCWWPAARRLARTGLVFGIVFIVSLALLDRLWVGYAQPFEHVQRILNYGAALHRTAPSGIESYPWQWLWNDTEIPYIRVEQQIRSAGEVVETRPVVLFLGAMNPYVLQLWPLGLAFAAYTWWRRSPGARLGALALAWFVMTYAPFYLTTLLTQRISYLFYFLPTLPAVALAGSYFLLHAGLPRPVAWVYIAAVLLGFYGYFPFKPVP